MTTENQAQEPTDIETFSAAFTEALGNEKPETTGGETDAAAAGDAAADAAPAGADAAADAGAGDGAAADAGEAAADGGEGEGEAAEDAGEADAATDTAAAPAKAAAAPAQPAAEEDKPAGKAADTAQPAPDFNAEELDFIASYEKEWPDVAKAEALKRRAEYTYVVNHIFAEINRVYGNALQFTERAETAEHVSEIESQHGDYEKVYDDVVAWIDTQPGYLKSAYKKVQAEGTASEVADLVTRWKKETGYVAPAEDGAAGRTTVQQPAAAKDIPAKAKQAARRLSVVNGKRASVDAGAGDPADFSSAFAEATKA